MSRKREYTEVGLITVVFVLVVVFFIKYKNYDECRMFGHSVVYCVME